MSVSVSVAAAPPAPAVEPAAVATGARPARERWFWLALGGLLLAGLLLRLAILFSPLGELDADEAVVGLMARHIAFNGERPLVYYGQDYIGSLEAFGAAGLFWLFGGSSALLLKLVPTAFSLAFQALSALLARRLFGTGPALATAAYLALPPAMWAVWSTKARGGYAEVVCLGEALLLLTLWLAERRRPWWGAAGWGFVAGLAFWTHPLAAVYILPCLVYLAARCRRDLAAAEILVAAGASLLGVLPLLVYNAQTHLATLNALLKPADLPMDPRQQFFRFFRIGLPVLFGLGQPTTAPDLFDADWLKRPASHVPIEVALLLVLFAALALQLPTLRRLFARVRPRGGTGPALLLLLAIVVPPTIAFTRFGFLVSEPRYALPLYALVPLLMAAIRRLPRPARPILVIGLLALNLASLLTTDVTLWRPQDSPNSTPQNRAQLAAYLESNGRHQVYTDYWIAYPLMFETDEQINAYVISEGFNRTIPPADNVQRTPNPVWVMVPGSDEERDFLQQLRQTGATARVVAVAGYNVYLDMTPLDAMRPPA